MATALWGKVYYQELYAGRLHEEAGGRVLFTYDADYVAAQHPPLAHTLPLQ